MKYEIFAAVSVVILVVTVLFIIEHPYISVPVQDGNNPPPKLALDKWTYIQIDNAMPPRIDTDGSGGGYFFGIAFGDINGDGYKDVVAHDMYYKNSAGNMQGTWVRTKFPWDWTDAFAVTDVDEDQYADVIAEGEQSGNNLNIYWLEAQNTEGTSWNRVLIGTIPVTGHLWSQGYDVAQLVSGGKPEIIINGGDGTYYFSIPSNPSAGNWNRVKITNNIGDGFAVGDIDGDGNLDIVGGIANTNQVLWWKNPRDGSGNWASYTVGNGFSGVIPDRFAVADINKDGHNDIVASDEEYPITQGISNCYWFKGSSNPQSGQWQKTLVISNAYSLNSMSVVDMSNDSYPEIVLGEMGNQKRTMIFENVNGVFGNPIVIATGKESHLGAKVVDLDSDGNLDIVSIAWNAYQYVHLFRNDALSGTTIIVHEFEHVIIDNSTFANVRAVGDIDGDGYSDIVAAKVSTGLTWYKYPSWTKYTIGTFNWQADDIDVVDIDKDGDLDVVGVQESSGQVYWYENPRPNGVVTNVWTSHYIGINNAFVKDLEIDDFNRDGKPDVVTRTPQTTSIFVQNSTTSWINIKTLSHTFIQGDNCDGLDTGDIDGDGIPDLVLNGFWYDVPSDLTGVWSQYYTFDAKWYNQNTGDWRDNNAKVAVADINKDGRLDIVISQNEKAGYPVTWYESTNPIGGSWTGHIISIVDYCHTLKVGDMDNDGNLDIVVGKFQSDDGAIPSPYFVKIFYNKGSGANWEEFLVDSISIYTGTIGDIGNDGDLDIVGSRSYWEGPVEIWINKLK